MPSGGVHPITASGISGHPIFEIDTAAFIAPTTGRVAKPMCCAWLMSSSMGCAGGPINDMIDRPVTLLGPADLISAIHPPPLFRCCTETGLGPIQPSMVVETTVKKRSTLGCSVQSMSDGQIQVQRSPARMRYGGRREWLEPVEQEPELSHGIFK